MKRIAILLNLLFISSINSINLQKKTVNSEYAIQNLQERVSVLTDTSCKVAAKFMLLIICNIDEKDELSILPLTHHYIIDLENIKEKVMRGDVLQIEIRPNHHFIIFKKNNEDLYLLQAFQDRLYLKQWISNEKIMAPYLTIDSFFRKMSIMLNPKTPFDIVDKMVIDLFLPPIFTTDQKLIQSTLFYFKRKPVVLVNVNYVDFDFTMQKKGPQLQDLFNKVDRHYLIY